MLADVVVVQEPQRAIGPDNIRAALPAIPIPLCTPGEDLHPVFADSAITAM
ncbi:MAG: hypothetical protein HOV87_09820, partial [Catenulispora sp.]|nr:hypothetical protein [Catenulispora sp.]